MHHLSSPEKKWAEADEVEDVCAPGGLPSDTAAGRLAWWLLLLPSPPLRANIIS